MKHTENGPWCVVGSTANGRDWKYYVNNKEGEIIFTGHGSTPEEAVKNGKLSESAPELLEALKEAADQIKHMIETPDFSKASAEITLNRISKPIKKASE